MTKQVCSSGPLVSFVLSSPIGDLAVTCCSKAVHSLLRVTALSTETENLTSSRPNASVKVEMKQWISSDDNSKTYPVVQQCMQWLTSYFHPQNAVNGRPVPMPAVCHLTNIDKNDSPFTARVWETLMNLVPAGRTLSYGELAVLCGSTEKNSRAVGQAMRTNPVILLVPCHRVLLSSGKIGNYSAGGTVVKQWLLDHEKSFICDL